MQRITLAAGAILACTLVAAAAAGDKAQKQSPAMVEMTIRAPDGRPVADTEVQFLAYDEMGKGDSCQVTAKTDGQGLVRFAWPCGSQKIRVKAPGAGYGVTGIFGLSPGETARPPLPRLAPYATIDGTVPKELRKPGMIVGNGKIDWSEGLNGTASEGADEWERTETVVAADGHYVLKEVPYGYCFLHAEPKGEQEPSAELELFVEPGQSVRDVVLAKSPFRTPPKSPNARADEKEQTTAQPVEKPKEQIVWAEGTVRDESGRTLEGVQVFARVFGNLYPVEAEPTLSDANGRWRISGEAGWDMARGELLFCKFGYCYAFAPLRCPESGEKLTTGATGDNEKSKAPAKLKPPGYDIVLRKQCGGLEVLVTRNNKPLADAVVSIAIDAPAALALSAADAQESWNESAARILRPAAVTGQDGIARFNDLVPGVYGVTVAGGGKTDIGSLDRSTQPTAVSSDEASSPNSVKVRGASVLAMIGGGGLPFSRPVPTYCGVVVEAEKTRKFHAVVQSENFPVAINLRDHDGKPAAHFDAGYNGGFGARFGNDTFDENGLVVKRYGCAGLQEVSFRYTEGFSAQGSLNFNFTGDYYKTYRDVTAVAATSDLLRKVPPVTITLARHTSVPGSLVVQLQDPAGKPAAGYVFVNGVHGLSFAASTDQKGSVRLDGVLSTMSGVEGVLPGVTAPHVDWFDWPLPSDKNLVGRWAFSTRDAIDCPNGAETRIVMRAAPIGYIRGVVHPAAGRSADNYAVVAHGDAGFSVRKSGEFVAGPFPIGKMLLELQSELPEDHWMDCASQTVDVRSDLVAHVEFHPPALAPEPAGRFQLCGADSPGPIDSMVDVEVTVTESDGRTPAWGAQVALLIPNSVGAYRQGTTDSQGKFLVLSVLPRFYWSPPELDAKRDQIPTEPMIVAWFPGEYGPAIAPVKQATADGKLRLVLPPSSVQRGKITIAGKEFSELPNELQVMAAREGPGPLSPLFAQYVSADPEGNFELPALAPGVYQVQATLDNIWLSPSARITVSADAAPLKPITLNIDEPGYASTVTVLDRQGKPIVGVKVTVDRPAGPLAKLLWPWVFATDGAGVAQIPPLEAGRHRLQIAGAAGESIITVPPLSDPKAEPASLRVTVDRP